MDETWVNSYEESRLRMIEGGKYEAVGYVSYIVCRRINENSVELSWYPNIHDRFHEVTITLPKDQLVICVELWKLDEDPHLFVKSEWLENLYSRAYTVFCMIDAIGVKNALLNNKLTKAKLIELRNEIDYLAKEYPDISFISFADNFLLKSSWTVGCHDNEINYTYRPELFFGIIKK